MASNPYIGMLNIMQKRGEKYNSQLICIGQVVTKVPITVKIGDLSLVQDDLLIAESLKQESLRVGDSLVMILVPNKQKYIILCKVVSL